LPRQACENSTQNLRGDNAALAKSRFGGRWRGLDLIEKRKFNGPQSTTNQINKKFEPLVVFISSISYVLLK
jgi:hypothetical protein